MSITIPAKCLAVSFLLFLLTSVAVTAQTYTVTPNPASVEVDLNTTSNPYEIVAEAMITNTTSTTLNLKWERIINNKPDCWETSVFGVWIQAFPTVDSLEFDLDPNDSGFFNISAFTDLMGSGSKAGEAEVVLKITNLNDATDTLLVNYNFLATGDMNCITGFSEIEYEALQIYPNPATGFFRLRETQGLQYLQIYSLLGYQLYHYDIAPGQVYPIGDLPTGLYVVKLFDRKHEVLKTIKLIKA